MRSLALIALGALTAAGLSAQSLAEHAAAAAGATAGTAAGKPIGTALGNIFGNMNKQTANAAGAKKTKPAQAKVHPKTLAKPDLEPTLHPNGATAPALFRSSSAGSAEAPPFRHFTRRRPEAPVAAAVRPIASEALAAPLVIEAPKQPTAQEFAAIKVGESGAQLQDALGVPESKVSIPADDGHLIQICDFWSHGEPLGRVRLDDGKVVSVSRSSGN